MSDTPTPRTTDRTDTGRVWLRLVHRVHDAARDGDKERAVELSRLADAIEREFPDDIAHEKAFWGWKEAANV